MAQAVRLEEYLADVTEPVILAGDFNSDPDSEVMAYLDERWVRPDKGADHYSFPSWAPDQEIDFVLVRPGERFEVLSHRLLDEPVASDHRPLLMELIIRD